MSDVEIEFPRGTTPLRSNMPPIIPNSVFGKITVLYEVIRTDRRGRWIAIRCSCGTTGVREARRILAGRNHSCSPSCGNTRDDAHRKHPLYVIWLGIRRRCQSRNEPSFPRYGGRGISVCQRWNESFEAFVEDMGPRPSGTTIDRIDNDGNYEPGNCRWATQDVQLRNRSDNHWITFNGRTMILADWSSEIGISVPGLIRRLQSGRPLSEVLVAGKMPPRSTTQMERKAS